MSALRIAPDVAGRIRLVILDVDGVLTDGTVQLGAGENGARVELKRFHIVDGLGIGMLRRAGIRVDMVSGRPSPANHARGAELGIAVHEGAGGFKLDIVEGIQAEAGVSWAGTACVCDDLADLPIFRRAGLAVAVANAVPELMAVAHAVTSRRGGDAAVREFAEALLRARGQWAGLVAEYVAEREPASDLAGGGA